MAVWDHRGRIPKEKRHAFLYQVIMRQMHKLYYYTKRDNKISTIDKEETSEGDHFDLLDITDVVDQMDEYSYFELMDAIQNALDEEEFQLFMYYLQGIPISQLRGKLHKSFQTITDKYEVIKQKLTVALGQDVKFAFLFKRVSGKKGKTYVTFSDEHKKHLSDARQGYKHSEESKQKISESLKAQWKNRK